MFCQPGRYFGAGVVRCETKLNIAQRFEALEKCLDHFAIDGAGLGRAGCLGDARFHFAGPRRFYKNDQLFLRHG